MTDKQLDEAVRAAILYTAEELCGYEYASSGEFTDRIAKAAKSGSGSDIMSLVRGALGGRAETALLDTVPDDFAGHQSQFRAEMTELVDKHTFDGGELARESTEQLGGILADVGKKTGNAEAARAITQEIGNVQVDDGPSARMFARVKQAIRRWIQSNTPYVGDLIKIVFTAMDMAGAVAESAVQIGRWAKVKFLHVNGEARPLTEGEVARVIPKDAFAELTRKLVLGIGSLIRAMGSLAHTSFKISFAIYRVFVKALLVTLFVILRIVLRVIRYAVILLGIAIGKAAGYAIKAAVTAVLVEIGLSLLAPLFAALLPLLAPLAFLSDPAAKTDVAALTPEEQRARVDELVAAPIAAWSYIDGDGERRVGAMVTDMPSAACGHCIDVPLYLANLHLAVQAMDARLRALETNK